MVDPGECITESLQREFGEEAMNTDKFPERADLIKKMLSNGQLIYQGYVDDPRNTDNAWMETQGIYTPFYRNLFTYFIIIIQLSTFMLNKRTWKNLNRVLMQKQFNGKDWTQNLNCTQAMRDLFKWLLNIIMRTGKKKLPISNHK